MHCEQALQLLDDYLDHQLPDDQQAALAQHLAGCSACQLELEAQQQLLAQLRALPVVPPQAGFAARALRRARAANHSARTVFATGFGSAIAAVLLVWFALGLWQPADSPSTSLKLVSMQVAEARTISLAFNSPDELKNVTFQLELPEGVMLANRPGQRLVSWQDQLQRGRNVLQLTLVGQRQLSGDLIARIQHAEQQRIFRIPLQVQKRSPSSTRF